MDAHQELETVAGQYLARGMKRQSNYFEAFLRDELTYMVNRVVERVVGQMVERLAERFTASPAIHHERSEHPERVKRATPAIAAPKAAVLKRLQAMQAEGFSLQAMANRLNHEGVPTPGGKWCWQKGTSGRGAYPIFQKYISRISPVQSSFTVNTKSKLLKRPEKDYDCLKTYKLWI